MGYKNSSAIKPGQPQINQWDACAISYAQELCPEGQNHKKLQGNIPSNSLQTQQLSNCYKSS